LESHFPGELWLECVYKLDPVTDTLTVDMTAITDKPTPVNLTNHTYFNLAGEETGKATYDHLVKLNCDRYLDFDPQETTVTGKVNGVEGTKYDFREYQRLGDRIKAGGKWPEEGFDNYFLRCVF
jgi:aldose 1-epimerase